MNLTLFMEGSFVFSNFYLKCYMGKVCFVRGWSPSSIFEKQNSHFVDVACSSGIPMCYHFGVREVKDVICDGFL